MLSLFSTVTDTAEDITIIAPVSSSLENGIRWLESLLNQGHSLKTEVLLICPKISPKSQLEEQINSLFKTYQQAIKNSVYKFYIFDQHYNLNCNQSLNDCLNNAVKKANGKWIYILDCDSQILKNTFLEFVAVIKEFPSVDIISGRFYRLSHQQKIIEKSPDLAKEGFVEPGFQKLFLHSNPLRCSCSLYRRDIWLKTGGLRTELKRAAQWEWLRRLVHGDFAWYYIPRYLCCSSMTQNRGQLFDDQDRVDTDFLKVLHTEYSAYSLSEIKQAKTLVSKQLFQYIDLCFQENQYSRGYAAIFDFLSCINLGDRLWLDNLRSLKQSNIKHKDQLLSIIQELEIRVFS